MLAHAHTVLSLRKKIEKTGSLAFIDSTDYVET